MSLTKLTDNLNKVSSLPDKPTLQPEELKAVFDEAANSIKDYINDILTTEIEKLISNSVAAGKVTVENVLTSTSVNNALSAAQGKVVNDVVNTLKTKLDGIASGANKTIINNTLTSTSTSEALSANQGRALKSLIDSLTTTVNGKQKTITRGTSAPSGGSNGDIYIQYF